MKKNKLLFVFVTLFTVYAQTQTSHTKIKELVKIDGTLTNVLNYIDNRFTYYEQHIPKTKLKKWQLLQDNIRENSLIELNDIVTPIYIETYSEAGVDKLLSFFNSDTGKMLVTNHSTFTNKINEGLQNWSQNFNCTLDEEIKNLKKDPPSSEQIKKIEQQFKDKYGFKVLNISDLSIEEFDDVSNLLIDFGKVSGKEDITKIIRVKNISNSVITIENPSYFNNKSIGLDFGGPIKAGEIRDLKITLKANYAENLSHSMLRIKTNKNKERFKLAIKYQAPAKKISYAVTTKSLKFTSFDKAYSDPYIFMIKNTGTKEFHISDINTSSTIAYINYTKGAINENETLFIRVIFAKDLMKEVNLINLQLEVSLTKGENNFFSEIADSTIKLSIKQ